MTTHQAAHVAVLEAARECALSHLGLLTIYDLTDGVEETRALIDRIDAAIDLMKHSVEPVGAIDETGEPYLYLSTDLPRGTLLYTAPTEASR
jgi:hypothetical protein